MEESIDVDLGAGEEDALAEAALLDLAAHPIAHQGFADQEQGNGYSGEEAEDGAAFGGLLSKGGDDQEQDHDDGQALAQLAEGLGDRFLEGIDVVAEALEDEGGEGNHEDELPIKAIELGKRQPAKPGASQVAQQIAEPERQADS